MPSIPLLLAPEPDDPASVQVFANGAIGDNPIRFLVDTGARTCLVPRSLTHQLPSLKRSTSTGAANTIVDDDEVIVPTIRVGDVTAHDVEADRGDLTGHRHPLLGMSFLGRHRCRFQLAAGVLEIAGPSAPTADPRALDEGAQGLPFVPVDFGDVVVSACWDTGASRSVVDTAWAKRHPELVEIGGELAGHNSAGIEVHAQQATLASCSIADVRLPASPCVAIDLDPLNSRLDQPIELIVGVPVIRAADWWFDFPARQWHVQPL